MTKIRKIIGIIPSRYASTRFPGKPLADIRGRSMVMRVYDKALASGCDIVIVATDDKRIYDHVRQSGGQVMMTDPEHISGTDRCAEIAINYDKDDIIINIQGDEPFLDPAQINELISLMTGNEEIQIGTQCRKINDPACIHDPNIVKLVKDIHNRCMYFSRSTIPFVRAEVTDRWIDKAGYFQHIGLYAFRQSILMEITKLPPGRLEQAESLEQLRWLEAGYLIHTVETEHHSIGIDSPEDLERAVNYYNGKW